VSAIPRESSAVKTANTTSAVNTLFAVIKPMSRYD
jgi:hypothetical protein